VLPELREAPGQAAVGEGDTGASEWWRPLARQRAARPPPPASPRPSGGALFTVGQEASPAAAAAPSPTAGDPLGRKALGREASAWVERGCETAAAAFLARGAPAGFDVAAEMASALGAERRPRGGAALAACDRAAAHFPTLWDGFQRAVGVALESRAAAGEDWRGSPAWRCCKQLAASTAHRVRAAAPRTIESLAGTQRRVAAAEAASLAERVAAYCDSQSAALLAERSEERRVFEALRLAAEAEAEEGRAPPPVAADGPYCALACLLSDQEGTIGAAPGPKLLRGLQLVATSTSASGRKLLTLRPAGGGALAATALARGDWVALQVEGGAACNAFAWGVEGRITEMEGADGGAGLVLALPMRDAGTEAEAAALAGALGAPPPPASVEQVVAALAGRRLTAVTAPDGVTFRRQMAGLAALRRLPLAPRARPPPAAAIVAALFPHAPPAAAAEEALWESPPATAASSSASAPTPAGRVNLPGPAALPAAGARAAATAAAAAAAVGDLLQTGAASYATFADAYHSLSDAAHRLDPSQRAAAAAGLARCHAVSCVQGPPGSGKTAVIVETVLRAVGRGERVLVAAPTNAAVDCLALRLAAAGLRCVRLGDASGLGEELAGRMSLDMQVEARLGGSAFGCESLGALRAELRGEAAAAARARDSPRGAAARAALSKLARSAKRAAAEAEADLLGGAQVVLATCSGCGEALLDQSRPFDLAVLDEAGQATQPSSWLPLLRARRALLVGDSQQLAPTVLSSAARAQGLSVSLMQRAEGLAARLPRVTGAGGVAEGGAACVRTQLRTQYRSNEAIAGWASRASYGGRLLTAAAAANRLLCHGAGVEDSPLTRAPLLLLSTRLADGRLAAGCAEAAGMAGGAASLRNEGEAAAVVRHVLSLLQAGVPGERVAVLSPYAAQVSLLRALLAAEAGAAGVRAWSVDAFQGREAEAVVISMVRAQAQPGGSVGFLADRRRMNVAVTRARAHVALVADPLTVAADRGGFLAGLLAHAAVAPPWGTAVGVQEAAEGRAPWHQRG